MKKEIMSLRIELVANIKILREKLAEAEMKLANGDRINPFGICKSTADNIDKLAYTISILESIDRNK